MKTNIALAGNPNSGKTTLFNELTGARQHVGNYPGVTVEKKEGTCLHADRQVHIVDLPGTYSLTAYSMEEVVARDFLVNEKPGAVILAISILLWAMMTFPALPEKDTQVFETQRQTLKTEATPGLIAEIESIDSGSALSDPAKHLSEALLTVDAMEAEAALRHSVAGRLGTALENLSKWAGFDWRTDIALVGGFAAKEIIVATMGTAYSLGDVDPEASGTLSSKLADSPNWRPLTAVSLILFVLFYAPCFVSVVCIIREAGSWKWGAFTILFNTIFAFLMAVAVFQIGTLLGF